MCLRCTRPNYSWTRVRNPGKNNLWENVMERLDIFSHICPWFRSWGWLYSRLQGEHVTKIGRAMFDSSIACSRLLLGAQHKKNGEPPSLFSRCTPTNWTPGRARLIPRKILCYFVLFGAKRFVSRTSEAWFRGWQDLLLVRCVYISHESYQIVCQPIRMEAAPLLHMTDLTGRIIPHV